MDGVRPGQLLEERGDPNWYDLVEHYLRRVHAMHCTAQQLEGVLGRADQGMAEEHHNLTQAYAKEKEATDVYHDAYCRLCEVEAERAEVEQRITSLDALRTAIYQWFAESCKSEADLDDEGTTTEENL